MSAPILDMETIENLRLLGGDDDSDFLREVIAIFLEDTPVRIAELDQSLSDQDTIKFTRTAHTIKGSSSNVGAMELRAAAELLEQHAKHAGLANVEAMIDAVRASFERAKIELEKLRS